MTSEPVIFFLGGHALASERRGGGAWSVKEVFSPWFQRLIDRRPLVLAGKVSARNGAQLQEGSRPVAVRECTGVLGAQPRFFIVPFPGRPGAACRVKILDAWAHGVPVSIHNVGAERDRVQHREKILIADDVRGFAASVIEILTNDKLCPHLQESGKKTLDLHYDWKKRICVVSMMFTGSW